jgi:catechol 2,3-dioxygenase-like lactoylglutathione lyase family enzyme
MLEDGKVAARIPVQDLQRAKSFYEKKLGLEPSEERPGGLLYRSGSGEFALFESAGAPLAIIPRWRGRSKTSRRRWSGCERVEWCSRNTTFRA